MMMSIALRFIPTLIEETDKISVNAQKARGAQLDTGKMLTGSRRFGAGAHPLFISAFRPCRRAGHAHGVPLCYRGGDDHTGSRCCAARSRTTSTWRSASSALR